MSIVKAALRPKNEAPRKTGQGPRGTTNYISSNNNTDSTTALRLQRLRLLGIIGFRAAMLADLAWETSHG
jgi:hypothetical protein